MVIECPVAGNMKRCDHFHVLKNHKSFFFISNFLLTKISGVYERKLINSIRVF